jgi:hypothetical protein
MVNANVVYDINFSSLNWQLSIDREDSDDNVNWYRGQRQWNKLAVNLFQQLFELVNFLKQLGWRCYRIDQLFYCQFWLENVGTKTESREIDKLSKQANWILERCLVECYLHQLIRPSDLFYDRIRWTKLSVPHCWEVRAKRCSKNTEYQNYFKTAYCFRYQITKKLRFCICTIIFATQNRIKWRVYSCISG